MSGRPGDSSPTDSGVDTRDWEGLSNQMGCLSQRKILGKCPHTPPLMQHIFGPQ